jgi:hypothetical protein
MTKHQLRLTPTRTQLGTMAFAAALGACLGACSGGSSSSGSSGGATGTLSITDISVTPNSQWQINRPIAVTFNGEIDFATVSLNTLQVFEQGGVPVVGEFSFAQDAQGNQLRNVVQFQPRCPQNADLSDSGFLPGGRQYTVNVVGSPSGSGVTIRSASGAPVRSGRTVNFFTPNSSDLGVLFLDQRPGAPASAVVRADAQDIRVDSTYLQNGAETLYFETSAASDADSTGAVLPLEAGSDTVRRRAKLNLYSNESTRVAILLALDQAIDPSSTNISTDRLRLQYLDTGTVASGTWKAVDARVELQGNCTGTGALLLVNPLGVLPQGRVVRLQMTEEFRDLSGESFLLPQTLLSFEVETAKNPGTETPGDAADEYREEFTFGSTSSLSNFDSNVASDAAPASWGDGQLAAGFDFDGSGGPGGAFDWTIVPPTGSTTVNFDTNFQQITNNEQTVTQTVIGGIVDVRDMVVPANAILRVIGPNPLIIRATRNITIAGRIDISGSSNRGVVTFSSTNIPEEGASGNGGGGRGGDGSYLTTQSTPAGETGYGPFNTPGGGGTGGDAGWSTTTTENNRRGGGGGGGAFGPDVLLANGICPDQTIIGLDGEPGAAGGPAANSAVLGVGTRARGGALGPRPFSDASATNNFFGTMVTASGPLRGELGTAWAGAGGGGGGDSSSVGANGTWPPPFTPTGDEKGSGAGGGGGQLIIYCLGDVIFQGSGLIQSNGGTGGGGENTSGINRVGSGSGGGSGGHIIIQAAGKINFSGLTSNNGGIRARGGQGGEGAGGLGGASPYGVESGANQDLIIHGNVEERRAYGTTPPCAVTGNASTQFGGFFDGAGATACQCLVGTGGDGGPGLIQLHVNALADIIPPTGAVSLSQCVRPPAVGQIVNGLPSNTPANWSRLLPKFGKVSKAQSKWFRLGATSVPVTAGAPAETVAFQFGGTDTATGNVRRQGTGQGATVQPIAPILSGTLNAPTTAPYVGSDARSVVVSATSFADDIYVRNPQLLRGFELEVDGVSHVVAAATYDAVGGTVTMTVATSGTPLAGSVAGGDAYNLRQRFFRVSTDGVLDSLPASSNITIEFQAAKADVFGNPDETQTSVWVKDVALLNSPTFADNDDLRFIRFRVAFDIGADLAPGAPIPATTPIPALDFLRLPYRF